MIILSNTSIRDLTVRGVESACWPWDDIRGDREAAERRGEATYRLVRFALELDLQRLLEHISLPALHLRQCILH